MRFVLALAALAAPLLTSPPAVAAGSLDTCTGIVASIPAIITTQGTWCLDHDLTTASTSTAAVEIRANNVTLDCNGFKLGNLAAGVGTFSTAVYAEQRSNITVRGCSIRGFRAGIYLSGSTGGGHLVEDNRLEGVTSTGMYVVGPVASVVQRNRVQDTGGAPGSDRASAIMVLGDAIDNIVDGVSGPDDVENFAASGIYAGGFGSDIPVAIVMRGNRVRNIVSKGVSQSRALSNAAYGVLIEDNQVANLAPTEGLGVYCSLGGRAVSNRFANWSTPLYSCTDGGDNTGF